MENYIKNEIKLKNTLKRIQWNDNFNLNNKIKSLYLYVNYSFYRRKKYFLFY